MSIFILIACLLVFAAVVLVAVALLMPAVSEAVERVRVEREAAEASWRIHQRATAAFGQMLKAARDVEDREPKP